MSRLKKRIAIGSALVLLVIAGVCGWRAFSTGNSLKIDAEKLVGNFEYVINLRYTGYDSARDNGVIKKTFNKELSEELLTRLSHVKDSDYVDITSYVTEYTEKYGDGPMSTAIVSNESKTEYGVYLDTVGVVDNKIALVICGQTVVVDVSGQTEFTGFKGDKKYNLNVDRYTFTDNRSGYISVKADKIPEMSFEEYTELYPEASYSDYTQSEEGMFFSVSEIYEVKIDKNGRISKFDLDNVTGALE